VSWDRAALASLHAAREVRIHVGERRVRGVVIWVVVADDAVFVRSVRGPARKWFVAATQVGRASLEIGDRQMPVSVVPIGDDATIASVSRAFLSKYASSPYVSAMVAPATLATTLRLDPAATNT